MRSARPTAHWADEFIEHFLTYGHFELAYREIPADFPAINIFPRYTPDTKEVEAIVAKHLPDETKTDRRPRESWIRRWFGQPEVTYIKLEPGQEPLSAALTPPTANPVIQPAVMSAEPEPFETITEFTNRAVRHSIRAREQGIIDGLQLAIDHIEAAMVTVDMETYRGEVTKDAYVDCIARIESIRDKALELVNGDN